MGDELPTTSPVHQFISPPIEESCQLFNLHLIGGKIQTTLSDCDECFFVFHFYFWRHRLRSSRIRVDKYLNINQSFIFKLPSLRFDRWLPSDCILYINNIINLKLKFKIIITKEYFKKNIFIKNDLISSTIIDYRKLLLEPLGVLDLNLKLYGVGPRGHLEIGTILVKLTLLIDNIDNLKFINKICVDNNIYEKLIENDEKNNEKICEKINILENWLKEISQKMIVSKINIKKKNLKLFSNTENSIPVTVTYFVKPISLIQPMGVEINNKHFSKYYLNGRGEYYNLLSPLHAVKFVSNLLLPPGVRHKIEENDQTIECFIATGSGNESDHANLLCSFFLGFGLDAWVALGTDDEDANRSWVITRGYSKLFSKHWNPSIGRQFDYLDHKKPYCRLHAVYNDIFFYANISKYDRLHPDSDASEIFYPKGHLCLDFENNSKIWYPAPLGVSENESACRHPLEPINDQKQLTILPLIRWLPPNVDVRPDHICFTRCDLDITSSTIEDYLRLEIEKYRSNDATIWDSQIRNPLMMALSNYEMDATVGITYGLKVFEEAIRCICGQNMSLKAFPIQFNNLKYENYFNIMKSHEMCINILKSKNSEYFGLCVKSEYMAEDIMTVWVIFAVVCTTD
eukprot:GHVL01005902.1.p1 GENE.GHVL01005902.1~~GHVL01005902.1.p1  ORF type:complete len:628 (-),score=178.55 GHVL01005902.1:27-1910(-)